MPTSSWPSRRLHDASLLIGADGRIAAINPESGGGAPELSLNGQWLLPGMVDLHCDAVEKEVEPRARVLFPLDFACINTDRRNAAAGITTPYHALSFAHAEWGVRNNETATELVRALRRLKAHELIDNRVHVRYEITDLSALPHVLGLLDEGGVDLLSIMDHTPGQGQFKHLDSYIAYMMGNHGSSEQAAPADGRGKNAGPPKCRRARAGRDGARQAARRAHRQP